MADLGKVPNHDKIPATSKEEFPNSLLNNNYPIIGNLPLTRFEIYKLISKHLYEWLYKKIEVERNLETKKIKNLKNGSDFEPNSETKVTNTIRNLTDSQKHSKKDLYVTNIILAITELTAYALTIEMPIGSAAFTKNVTEGKYNLKTGFDKYYNDLKKIEKTVSKFKAEDGQKVFHPSIEKDIESLQSMVFDLLDTYKSSAKTYKSNIFGSIIQFYQSANVNVSEIGHILELTLDFFEKSKYEVFKSAKEVTEELKDHLLKFEASQKTTITIGKISYEHLYDLLSKLEELDPQQRETDQILASLKYAHERLTKKDSKIMVKAKSNGQLPFGRS